MPTVLPFLSFIFLTTGFRQRNNGWRDSLLFATIPWALFVAFATEGLSVFYWITRPGIIIAWLCFTGVCLYWMTRARRDKRRSESDNQESPATLELSEKIGLCGIITIVALTGLTALVSAPNNWDAMEYHMPRLVEWISNQSVRLYPTIDRQQLSMPPFSEYTMLHLDLLYGSDRLVNLVQWFASVGCIVGVSLITKLLGGNRRAQIFAAALAATVPAGILGASNVKNDYVLSFWIVLAVYLLLRWRTHQTWPDTLAIAASLSLAIFTKGTAYAFLPFLVLACLTSWDWPSTRRMLVRLPVIALLLICVNATAWARNYSFSGSIFGLPYFDGAGQNSARMFGNSHITLTRSLANLLRGVGLNMAVPNDGVNRFTTHVLSGWMRLLGVDPNDPSQIVIGQSGLFRPFAITFASRNEAMTGNTLHFLLFVAALVVCLFAFRKMNRAVVWLGAGLVGAFFLYSALLRWSPFNARYQLPLFVLSAVVVAIAFSRVLPKIALTGLTIVLLVSAIPPALANQARPLVTASGLKGSILVTPRDETYFFDQHQVLADSFIAAAKATPSTDCRSVGVDANLLHYEYPFFALLTRYGGTMKISYVGVKNPTASLKPKLAEPPCRIVCLGCAGAANKLAEYSSDQNETEKFGDVVIFVPPGGAVAETKASVSR
jgi:hypothetical protein